MMKDKIKQEIKQIYIFMMELLCRMIPYNRNNQVIFCSLNGQYNDNPKYISEKLHELHENIRIVWVISNRCHEKKVLPSYIKSVNPLSPQFFIEKSRAMVLVDNVIGLSSGEKWSFIPAKIYKKKEQLNITTWHGTPLKKIGRDIEGSMPVESKFYSSTDYMLAGCRYTAEKLNWAFRGMPIKMTGTPRNDILFKQNIDIDRIKKKLCLPTDCKLLLYVPTFRNNVEDSGIVQLQLMNVTELLHEMKNKFGGEWKLIYRVHNVVLDKIDKSDFDVNTCVNGNLGDDMQEYLVCADAVISDYSGAIYDTALTNKPCFLFAHDLDHYMNHERGAYMKITDFPYKFSCTYEELVDNIKKFDYCSNEINRKEFLKELGDIEDGKASERIVKIIEGHFKYYGQNL